MKRFLQKFIPEFGATVRRFPLACACIIVSTALAIVMNHGNHNDIDKLVPRLFIFASSSFFWFTSIALLAENKGWTRQKHAMLVIPAGIILAGYFLLASLYPYPVFALELASFLFLIIAPYLFSNVDEDTFWHFNCKTFIAIMTAYFSGLVLSIGTVLALFSIEKLFGLNIKGDFYTDVWIIGMLCYGGFYFLSDLSKRFHFDSIPAIPKSISFINRFIQIPLICVYLIILYAYFIKLLIIQDIPNGHLGWLISVFGTLGIITHIAALPFAREEQHTVTRWFYRWFFPLLVIPTLMLVYAIWLRVSDYGITEPRYTLIAIAAWFAICCIWRIGFSAYWKTRYVITAACVLIAIAAIGPFSARTIAAQSQVSRLETVLSENNLLKDGKITPATNAEDVPTEATQQIANIVRYLRKSQHLHHIADWFTANPELAVSIKAHKPTYETVDIILEYINIDSENAPESRTQLSISAPHIMEQPQAIAGFSTMIQIGKYNNKQNNRSETKSYIYEIKDNMLIFKDINKTIAAKIGVAPLYQHIESFKRGTWHNLPSEQYDTMILDSVADSPKARFICHRATFRKDKDSGEMKIDEIEGVLLLAN